MPLTEEQKARLRARIGSPSPQASTSNGLPPQIQKIISSVPQGRPYPVQVGPGGMKFQVPPPQEEIGRQLAVRQAEQQVKAMNPPVSDAIKREFSRIDTFDGLFDDLNSLAKSVRKGPIRGRYAKVASTISGGGKVDLPGQMMDMEEGESQNAIAYAQLRAPVAAGFYRAITGDDRISDRDAAARALPLVPDLSLTPKAFEQRLRFVKRAVERKRRSIQKAIRLGIDPSSLAQTQDSSAQFQSSLLDLLANDGEDAED